MTIAARTGFIGLVTNVACTQAPPGSLQDAENVVLRRAGCVEPRDGISLANSGSAPAVWGFSLDYESDVVARWNGSEFEWEILGGSALEYDDPETGVEVPQPLRRDVLTYARSRGNVYVPADNGVYSVSVDEFERAGLPVVAWPGTANGLVAGTNNWLANNEQVAYRVVTVKTDANGVRTTSTPSGRSIATNTSGGARRPTLDIYFRGDFLGEFDAVEVYRTRSFATGQTVDDEMQFVASVGSGAFSAIGSVYFYTLSDEVSPSARGKTFYVSPSRGGINNRNERPPAAAAVAAFKGSVFFGNVRGPQQRAVSYNYSGGSLAGATGIGYRTRTGTIAIGSDQITLLSSATGIQRGQVIVNSPNFPDGTYITNISGATLTMSQVSTGAGAGVSFDFYDAVKVGTTWIPIRAGAGTSFLEDLFFTHNVEGYEAFSVHPPEGGYSLTWVLRTISRELGTDTIQASHGDEFYPPIPLYTETAETTAQDVFPGAIFWSKKDEPEHVAPIAFEFVGDKAKAILGLVPTRDALFILKEDGIFRLTGSGATEGNVKPWRIDPYDPTTRCLLPTSVKPMNGRAYFLSNKGVIAFGDAGAEQLSKPIHDIVRDTIDQVVKRFQSTGFYELEGVVGSTAAVFEREYEYTLMRSSTAPMLVYNENTNAWTTWNFNSANSLEYQGVWTVDRDGRVAYAISTTTYFTRLSTDAQLGTLTLPQHADSILTRTASGYSGGNVTLTAATTALAGDVIQDAGGKLWEVTTTTIAGTVFPVVGPSSTFTTGTVYVYRSLRCRVAPQTFYGDPAISKDNSPLTATFSRFEGPVALDFEYSSQLSPRDDGDWDSAAVPLNQPLGYAELSRGASYFLDVQNEHRRAWLLDVAVAWTMSHGTVRLEGVYLESRLGKQRARQHEEA